MASTRVVEPLDLVEHVGPSLIAGAIYLAGRPLGFQRGEEAPHGRVVPDIARPAHAAGDAVIGQQLLERFTAVLAFLVRVVEQRVRLASNPPLRAL